MVNVFMSTPLLSSSFVFQFYYLNLFRRLCTALCTGVLVQAVHFAYQSNRHFIQLAIRIHAPPPPSRECASK